MAKSAPPVAKFRVGWVTASVWENASGYYNTTLSKSYKEGDEYRETDSLSHGDLPCAILVLTRAESWIAEQKS